MCCEREKCVNKSNESGVYACAFPERARMCVCVCVCVCARARVDEIGV
jgi:hypothetical protein